ncbi:aldehyde dehydrogenase, partial [Wolfiporia cocos MD-104 SS10]
MSLPFTPLIINGSSRPASNSAQYAVRNPYTQEVVGYAAAATKGDVKDAVEAAERAFPAWEKSLLSTRRDIFMKAADLLETERYAQKIRAALKDETAATDFVVGFNMFTGINGLRVDAGATNQLKGESHMSFIPGARVVTQRRALGVVYAIAPWNFPITLGLRAIVIPLICGNTVILKCAEYAPRTQALIGELLSEAGLPDGVLNVISVDKKDVPARSAEIIAHPAVRKINFTGSALVAKLIAAEAAKHLKPCLFELGGKAPVIVLEDANIERAAKAIASSALIHSGQVCMSTERVIVQREVAPALKEALIKLFSSLKAGGPEETLSAVISQESASRIVTMMRQAQEAGAHVLVGDLAQDQSVVQPHLIVDVTPKMRLWNEESFGPVIALAEAGTLDEAIKLANTSEYSLMAALWTKDVNSAFDVADRINSGTVNVNGPTVHTELGMAGSGFGAGESGYGTFDVAEFTISRQITFHPDQTTPYP